MMDNLKLSLTYPPDIEEAWQWYRASCGPCALAAVTASRVMDVRDDLDDGYAHRGYMHPTHMKIAVDNFPGIRAWTIGARLPTYGLVFVQWGGHHAKPIKVQ
jgi:hypothetical protein